jgi:hypothetical protein
MSTRVKHAPAYRTDFPATLLVLDEKIIPLVDSKPVARLNENMIGVAPDEMRGITVGNDDSNIAPIKIGSQQPS